MHKYQTIFLGHIYPEAKEINENLLTKIEELKLNKEFYVVFDSCHFDQKYKANEPYFTLYYSQLPQV